MPIDPPLHSAGRGMVSVASEPRVKRVWRFSLPCRRATAAPEVDWS
jgi:hypothetical protein